MRDRRRTHLVRRGPLALAVLLGLAAGAFALGAAFGDSPPRRPPLVSTLSLTQLAGQRIVTGFSGAEAPRRLVRSIRAGEVGGVILFSDNLPGRAAGRRLIRRLQAIPRPPGLRDPLLVMTDQEGGLVKRIAGAPTASARKMGARGASFSRAQGARTAANLSGIGVNVDLAPVLDVARPGGTIAATDRGFGAIPARVATTAIPFAEGLEAIASASKAFRSPMRSIPSPSTPSAGSPRPQARPPAPARTSSSTPTRARRRSPGEPLSPASARPSSLAAPSKNRSAGSCGCATGSPPARG